MIRLVCLVFWVSTLAVLGQPIVACKRKSQTATITPLLRSFLKDHLRCKEQWKLVDGRAPQKSGLSKTHLTIGGEINIAAGGGMADSLHKLTAERRPVSNSEQAGGSHGGVATSKSPSPVRCLHETWRAVLGVNSPANVVVGRWDGQPYLCVQGTDVKGQRGGGVEALDADGRHRWRTFAGRGRGAGAYLQWLDLGADRDPLVVFSFTPAEAERPGGALVVRARDGVVVREIRNTTHFGNNNSLIADLDGDRIPEFIYADQSTLTCYELPEFRVRWRFDEAVRFCWSLPAAVDLNGDGRDEIVFGSEYNAGHSNSSMLAIDAEGKRIWRSDGHAEDLGSTPVFVADIDGDGTVELLKVGLDLEHRQKQQWNHLYVFDLAGKLRATIAIGFTGIALGDIDSDGHWEGVGLTNTRDGGYNGHREIRCVDLVTGRVDWTVPVERAYLDTNSPIMADIDGDGKLEAVVGTGNPAGYGRLPNSQPWGDLYVVDGRGEIRQHIRLPGWPVNMAMCDIDDDCLGELFVVIDGRPGWLARFETKTPTTRNDWPTPFGSSKRSGTMTPKGTTQEAKRLK